MELVVKASSSSYKVTIGKGLLDKANQYFNLDRKVLIVTDSNVPTTYVNVVKKCAKEGYVFVFKAGEASKNFDTYKLILEALLENSFTRSDCIVALGGGVTGDMAGFAASTYMRGIDFYNIPTTFLSMVDSSIGGKTAIDLNGVKNIVGAFYPPKGVLIDVSTLDTLPSREINAGLVESIKMAVTCNKDLFKLIETLELQDLEKYYEKIIYESLLIKKEIVELDEKESGVRKVLNFGHTFGHAIETLSKGKLLHGECVGIGMLLATSNDVNDRLHDVLNKYSIPLDYSCSKKDIMDLITHDKKASGTTISFVTSTKVGTYKINQVSIEELEELL